MFTHPTPESPPFKFAPTAWASPRAPAHAAYAPAPPPPAPPPRPEMAHRAHGVACHTCVFVSLCGHVSAAAWAAWGEGCAKKYLPPN